MTTPAKLRVATTSLAGCFGCHMSFLDIDERLFELAEVVEFDRSPLTDIKRVGKCDIGLIEGGVCNAENVHVLREFRAQLPILVAVGACAINGGLPAQRNHLPLECLQRGVSTGPGLAAGQMPNDPELPLLLNKVHPIHEVVRIDYFMPGCPPSGDAIWKFVTDLIAGPHAATATAAARLNGKKRGPTEVRSGNRHNPRTCAAWPSTPSRASKATARSPCCSTTTTGAPGAPAHRRVPRLREVFIQGRPYWEVPVMVQRLCGICPVSHHLAASRRWTSSSARGSSRPPPRSCAG
jgi:NAD-reducing hydrogenase small subunit